MSTGQLLGAIEFTIGAFIGSPSLMEMGATTVIGSTLAGLAPGMKGPQLRDLNVQVSTYGKAIPQLFGAVRIAGNVIWAPPLIQSEHTSGGKGGGPSYTSYSYAADFAVSLCAGPISGIGRIWADGTLIYNGTSADPGTILAGSAVVPTIYLGTETQTPDPLMQSFLGAANVPAYRGQAYLVFNNMQLANYGNRIPNIEAEVFTASSTSVISSNLATVPNYNALGNNPDWNISAPALSGINNFIVYVGQWDSWYIGYDVRVYQVSATNCIYLKTITATANTPFSSGVSDQPGFLNLMPNTNGMTYNWQGDSSMTIQIPESYNDPSTVSYAKTGNTFFLSNTIFGSKKVYKRGGGIADSSALANYCTIASDATYVYCLEFASPGRLTRLLASDLSLVDTTTLDFNVTNTYIFKIRVLGNGEVYVYTGSDIRRIIGGVSTIIFNTPNTGSNLPNFTVTPGGGEACAFNNLDSVTHRYGASQIYTRTITPGSVALSSIVTALCNQAGVTSIDATSLTDVVGGYVVGSQMSARNALEPLQKAFYFDAVESDNILKFVKRGTRAPIVISEDDLAAHEDGKSGVPPTVELQRAQELELPKVVNVAYYNTGNSYLIGAQRASRQVTNSQNVEDLRLAICMTDAKAKQVAEANQYITWTSRNAVKLSTSRKYGYLDPSDVVQISKSDGVNYNLLITKRTEKAGGIIDFEAVADDPSVYSQSAAGASPNLTVTTTINYVGPTHVELLDIPILRDADNDAGYYTGAGGYSSSWSGGALYKSSDGGSSYDIVETFRYPGSVLGSTTTVLGNFNGGNTFDEASTVTVIVDSGSLSSVANLDILNGANCAVIGQEVIQYRTATLIATNTYVLSGLLRGRVGTEQYIGTHIVGERFVRMDQSTTQRVSASLNDVGLSRLYKALSSGQSINSVYFSSFTNTAAGLKPLSPVAIGGGRDASGNLTINWKRRTRIGGSWNNYSDVPLGESSESYSIDIMSGTTVKRTLTSATPTVSYTSAMQVTDFGSNQSSVTVNVYQISASIGRGFAGIATI